MGRLAHLHDIVSSFLAAKIMAMEPNGASPPPTGAIHIPRHPLDFSI